MGDLYDDLTIAFAMQCDQDGLTYEQGLERAERLGQELEQAAEERIAFARVENPE